MPLDIQPSFSKGEISPSLYGRVDTKMYEVGLRKARNAIIHTYGGISNRPGMKFIGPCKDHSNPPRLFDFQFNTDDQYILEMGNLYMRVIRNNGHVLLSDVTITLISQSSPAQVSAPAHGYSNGDEVFIKDIVGMTELNNKRFEIADVTTNTFTLLDQIEGLAIDSRLFTAYTSAGVVAKVFELATPYLQADLANLKMVQSADTLTITHRSYAPRDLTRTDHTVWTLTVNTYAPNQTHPTAGSITVNGANNSVTYRYRVTAIGGDILEESLPFVNSTARTITGATAANPVVITSNSHAYANGDEVLIEAVVGMTEINNRRFLVASQAANTFELEGEDGTNHTAYSSAGTSKATFVETTAGTTIPDNTISWTAPSNAIRFAVYRRVNGIYGLVGETELTTYTEDNTANTLPDLTISPPRARNPFLLSGDFPGCSSYFEQRQIYGGSTDNPDTTFYSQAGSRLNMSSSTPGQADDAITATLTARDVHEIRHFVPTADLLILTKGGEWRITSGLDTAFEATTIRQKPQSTWGSSHDRPVIIGDSVLFVEDGGGRIRSLSYSFQSDSYTGSDLNLLASHLLTEDGPDEFIVRDWCATNFPEGRIYIVRSDGIVLTMSFDREQEVVAWTTWDTDGKFEQCAALRRGINSVEDAVYFVVRRFINGKIVRFIEKLQSRKFSNINDAFFLDSGLSLDSPITINDISGDPFTVIAPAHGFSDNDEIDFSSLVSLDGNEIEQINDRRFQVRSSLTDTFQFCEEKDFDVCQIIDISNITDSGNSGSVSKAGNFVFSTDGTKAWILEQSPTVLRQYTLTTAYDITTISDDNITFSNWPNVVDPHGNVVVHEDGTSFYTIIQTSDEDIIHEFRMSIPNDINGAFYSGRNIVVSSKRSTGEVLNAHNSFFISKDGHHLFLMDTLQSTQSSDFTGGRIRQYYLSLAWDISGASFIESKNIGTLDDSNVWVHIWIDEGGLDIYFVILPFV